MGWNANTLAVNSRDKRQMKLIDRTNGMERSPEKILWTARSGARIITQDRRAEQIEMFQACFTKPLLSP